MTNKSNSKKKVTNACAAFCDGHSCGQAILTTYAEQYNLEKEMAMKLTTGLAGGMGRMAKTCGTVTGSILVIGLAHSSGKTHDTVSKQATIHAVQKFSQQFEETFGSLECKSLLGHDISDAQGYQEAREANVFRDKCPHFVEGSVAILEDLLNQKSDNNNLK
ncbi:MAG: C_GCAxxG_C_C family protein [Thiotrichaceae bacterium]|nr:C_GCAxxG_C_C family protein [Thiotrichaceae bacterium]